MRILQPRWCIFVISNVGTFFFCVCAKPMQKHIYNIQYIRNYEKQKKPTTAIVRNLKAKSPSKKVSFNKLTQTVLFSSD